MMWWRKAKKPVVPQAKPLYLVYYTDTRDRIFGRDADHVPRYGETVVMHQSDGQETGRWKVGGVEWHELVDTHHQDVEVRLEPTDSKALAHRQALVSARGRT